MKIIFQVNGGIGKSIAATALRYWAVAGIMTMDLQIQECTELHLLLLIYRVDLALSGLMN